MSVVLQSTYEYSGLQREKQCSDLVLILSKAYVRCFARGIASLEIPEGFYSVGGYWRNQTSSPKLLLSNNSFPVSKNYHAEFGG